jgi:hypothetical protein
VFSAARAVCSVSSKDLLGKTVPRSRRGRLGGLASTAAGLVTLGAGLFFAAYDPEEFGAPGFAVLLAIAGAFWMVAAALMAGLDEEPGATAGAGNALTEAVRSVRILLTDRDFRNFCAARALLAGTILSMPFYVILAQKATGGKLAGLGILLIASSSATAVSAAVWGWMADRSSKGALAAAGMLAGLVGVLTFVVGGTGVTGRGALWLYGGLFFLIGIAHTGIRVGRKTYLVDMAPADRRASYVAVSNTLIGVVLLASGTIGFLAPVVGVRGVVLVFALLGLSGGLLAWALRETSD